MGVLALPIKWWKLSIFSRGVSSALVVRVVAESSSGLDMMVARSEEKRGGALRVNPQYAQRSRIVLESAAVDHSHGDEFQVLADRVGQSELALPNSTLRQDNGMRFV